MCFMALLHRVMRLRLRLRLRQHDSEFSVGRALHHLKRIQRHRVRLAE